MFSPESVLSLITAVFGVAIFGGWFAWLATEVQRRRPRRRRSGGVADPGPSCGGPPAWGEPEQAPSPRSSAAEIAELERLWRLPTHRADAGGDR